MVLDATIRVTGIDAVKERIGAIEKRAEDPRPALSIVADLLEAHVAEVFASGGTQAGAAWAPLAPSTVLARRRRWGYYGTRQSAGGVGPSSPVLVWSGRLRRSFARGGVAHIRRITSSSLTWGSGVLYGVFHQSKAPRSVLPRRAPLEFKDDFQRREIMFQPIRLWLQGLPAGAIRATQGQRLGLALPGGIS